MVEQRIARFCAEPLTAFTQQDALFPVIPGALSDEERQAILSRINQLIQDRHEDPRSFPLNISLGRAYARLAEHYVATGQNNLARPAVREAAAIRDALVAGDTKARSCSTSVAGWTHWRKACRDLASDVRDLEPAQLTSLTFRC